MSVHHQGFEIAKTFLRIIKGHGPMGKKVGKKKPVTVTQFASVKRLGAVRGDTVLLHD